MSPKSVTKSPVLLAVLVFGVALIAYTATLAPGLLWGGGDFATFRDVMRDG